MPRAQHTSDGYRYTVRRSRLSGERTVRMIASSIFLVFIAALVVGGVVVAKRLDKDKGRTLPNVEVEQAELDRAMPRTAIGSSRYLVAEDAAGVRLLSRFGQCDPGDLSGERAYADRYFAVPAAQRMAVKTPAERVGVGVLVWSFRSGPGAELGWRAIRSSITDCGGIEPKGANEVPGSDQTMLLDVDSVAANADGSTLRYAVVRWQRWVVVTVSSMEGEAIGAATRSVQTIQTLDEALAESSGSTTTAKP